MFFSISKGASNEANQKKQNLFLQVLLVISFVSSYVSMYLSSKQMFACSGN